MLVIVKGVWVAGGKQEPEGNGEEQKVREYRQ